MKAIGRTLLTALLMRRRCAGTTMNDYTWKCMNDRFLRWPQSRAAPVDPADFDRAMSEFGQCVDPDYREFVLQHGGGLVGPTPIYGLRKEEMLGTVAGNATAPELTRYFRSKRWPGVEEWLIFSIDHGGNPIGFATDCSVWLSDQLDFGQIVRLASGFEDYLLKWCLYAVAVE
jgi:hypothetical protein